MLIATLTTPVLAGIQPTRTSPRSVKTQASAQLVSGVPFVSDAQLEQALDDAGVDAATSAEIVDVNADARLEALRAALAIAALIAIGALFGTGRLPRVAPGTGGGSGAQEPLPEATA